MNTNNFITKYEKIGDTIFPVTYCENGVIFVDYPHLYNREISNQNKEKNKLFCEEFKNINKIK